MGTQSGGGAITKTKGVLEDDRALRLKDFADVRAIEEIAKIFGIASATVVKDFNTFRDFLFERKVLDYCCHDKTLISVSEWGYGFIEAVRQLREKKCKKENILAEALALCLDFLWSDHEDVCRATTAQEEMIESINQALKAALSEARTLTQELLVQKREQEFVDDALERTREQVEALTKLVSVMNMTQIQEREALTNIHLIDGLGEFIDLDVL